MLWNILRLLPAILLLVTLIAHVVLSDTANTAQDTNEENSVRRDDVYEVYDDLLKLQNDTRNAIEKRVHEYAIKPDNETAHYDSLPKGQAVDNATENKKDDYDRQLNNIKSGLNNSSTETIAQADSLSGMFNYFCPK